MKYTDFLVTVHQRYVLYASEIRFADCFMERLKEERPEIVERLESTGRKTVKKNGKTIVPALLINVTRVRIHTSREKP